VRRLAAVLAVTAAVVSFAPAAGAASWAQPQIKIAVRSGLMGPSADHFRANATLTAGELAQIVGGLTGEPKTPADPTRAITMTKLNRALVRALGLGPAAAEFQAELVRAKLEPPARAGWETVARLLGLRFNHPKERDDRERRPSDPATRAEAAYSVAQALGLSTWSLDRARAHAEAFGLPSLTGWQRNVLRRAVRFVGYPYVWGGMSESRQTLFGVTSRGGFDCSGFVWRVYKLQAWPGAPRLNTVIRGRTTYDMSGEVGAAQRYGRRALRPGDVIFFGSNGPQSRPSQVTHAGIAMGGGWFVHSSGNGTTLAPLEGWYVDTFAWARRPLAEAGLT
jgi:cell wall-associated NlpC family hydrolase